MTMDTRTISGITNEVVLGVKKEASRFVTDAETSKLWDDVTSDVRKAAAKAEAAGHKATFYAPNE